MKSSAPWLNPELTPIATQITESKINMDYTIYSKGFFCYEFKFGIKKRDNIFKLYLHNTTDSFNITGDTNSNSLYDIINSLGISNKKIFKVIIKNNDIKIRKKYYTSLRTVANFIVKNECIMECVGVE